MLLTVTTLILGVFTLVLFCFYRGRKHKHDLFKKMGIPGPEPHWLMGNFVLNSKLLPAERLFEWTKQYGKTYGYYEGPKPIIVTSDLELVKNIFIKHFDKFYSRKNFPVQPDPDSEKDVSLFTARGKRWKRLRTICNPTFTSAKMKKMYPMITKRVGYLLKRLHALEEKGASVNILDAYQSLTLETICECAFGVDLDSQSENNQILQQCQGFFMEISSKPFILEFPAIFPILSKLFWNLFMLLAELNLTNNTRLKINETIHNVISLREKTEASNRPHDFLQLLLNSRDVDYDISAEINENSKPATNGTTNRHSAETNGHTNTETNGNTPSSDIMQHTKAWNPEKKLTDSELADTCFLFLIAGYETTSSTLGYMSYLLATNPEVQKKLQEEIDQQIPEGEEPSYETIHKMEYLDQVWCETLRLYPLAASVINRTCMESCTIDGLTFPEGMAVQADVFAIHNDPEQWGPEDTKLFVPERFSQKRKEQRHSMAWLPFGAGPKNCIGLRFAAMEGKLAACQVLKNFTLETCKDTQIPLQLKDATAIQPKDGINIKLIARK